MVICRWDPAHTGKITCRDCFKVHPSLPQVQASCRVHSRQEALEQLSQGEVHLALASTHEFDKDCEFFKLV